MAEGVVYKVTVRAFDMNDPTKVLTENIRLVRAKNKAQARNYAADRHVTVEPVGIDEAIKLATEAKGKLQIEQVEA